MNRPPWWAVILTERGLATLLTLVLVGALIIGGGRLLDQLNTTGQQQVAQQERLIVKLTEAQATLERIERLLSRQALGERIDAIQLQLTDMDAHLDRIEELVRTAGGLP